MLTEKELLVVDCPLCVQEGGRIVWKDAFARVVLVGDKDHPGFCRVIVHDHVKELTDLEPTARDRLMRIVCELEQALRKLTRPDKVNLASLGNMVPHLHWHVIPRFREDPHFPNPVWGDRTGGRPRPVDSEFEFALAHELRQRLN